MNITIGIPVTRTKYLLETLRSVAAQTSPVREIIVVDNGADGDVASIISQVELPVRLIKREKRLPPVENWNKLLELVKTDWFVLLSDDDFFSPDHVSQLAQINGRFPECKVLHTRARLVDKDGRVSLITPLAPDYETAWDFLSHRILGYRIQFLSDFAWHTESLRGAGGFADLPSAWGSDDLTVFKVSMVGGIGYGSGVTFNYRIHPESISSSYAIEDKLVAINRLRTVYADHIGVRVPLDADEAVIIACIKGNLSRYERRSQRYLLQSIPSLKKIKLALFSWLGFKSYKISPVTLIRSLLRAG